MESKSNWLKILAWIFVSTVVIECIYIGFQYGCWLGLLAVPLGIVGLLYARFRKHKKV